MAKKETKPAKKAEEIEERDEAAEEGDEEETEDEAEARPAPARPASAQERRARMRAQRATAPVEIHEAPPVERGHGHDDHGHQEEDEDEIDTSNDPTWWVPHAVLGAMVLIGIFGFFGTFNGLAQRIGYKGIPGLVAASEGTSKPAENKPANEPQRPTPPMPPMPQQQGEVFGAKHLLVMYKGSMRAPDNISRTKDEAKARAEEARKKAKAGAKFEDLVKEYSDEPGAGQRGGDLGKFPKGRMVGPFQDAVEKTKVGDISDLVETPFGYHVILRTQ